MNTPFEVLQAIKREWTPDRFTRCTLARDDIGRPCNTNSEDARSFCGRGIIMHVTNSGYNPALGFVQPGNGLIQPMPAATEAARMIEDRIAAKGYQTILGGRRTIEGVNDDPDLGYAFLMGIIDELLLELAPMQSLDVPFEVVSTERELIPA